MEIGNQLELSSSEQGVCRLVAKMRYRCARSNGVHNAKIGDLSDDIMDLNGFGGELAFAKGFNVFPDFSIFVRSAHRGEDSGGDAKLPNGLIVDVKTTTRIDGRLLAQPWKIPGVDLFALMTGTFPTYIFRGFMPASELLSDYRLIDLGYGQGYAAEQRELLNLIDVERGCLVNIECRDNDLSGISLF